MKTTWPILLVLLLLAAPTAVHAQYKYTNSDGSIYVYITNADGVSITIAGYTGPPWAVTILSNINGLTVTSIGDSSFFNCTRLASVTFPTSVTSIQYYAFDGCASLTSVTIPASVTNVQPAAFCDCTNLPAITVDAQNAFYRSTNGLLFNKSQTTLVEFPGGIGGSYTVPSNITSIGECAFQGCTRLTNVMIPASVTSIGPNVFQDCSGLASVTIPTGLKSIPDYAFLDCINLAGITIPSSVTDIGFFAFYDCTNLTSITIPSSVTDIEEFAFSACPGLASVYFMGNPPSFGSDVFYTNNAVAYYLPGARGWSSSFADIPAVLWNPVMQTSGGSFGVSNNQFGFDITNGGTTNIPIVVQACANLACPVWTSLQTLTLTNSFYFSDPQWTNYPGRFYRISSP